MNGETLRKINGFGSVFRFITPTLVIVAIFFLNWLKADVQEVKVNTKELSEHFTNHLAHHKDLEVTYERRITTLENKNK